MSACSENKCDMQVMPSDDFSDDVTQITSTTPINRETVPLITNQPKKYLFFCRSVKIHILCALNYAPYAVIDSIDLCVIK